MPVNLIRPNHRVPYGHWTRAVLNLLTRARAPVSTREVIIRVGAAAHANARKIIYGALRFLLRCGLVARRVTRAACVYPSYTKHNRVAMWWLVRG